MNATVKYLLGNSILIIAVLVSHVFQIQEIANVLVTVFWIAFLFPLLFLITADIEAKVRIFSASVEHPVPTKVRYVVTGLFVFVLVATGWFLSLILVLATIIVIQVIKLQVTQYLAQTKE